MTRIVKQFDTTDARGRIVARTFERLIDDGDGQTRVVRTTVAGRCPGCRRLLAGAEQVTGHCAWCGRGPLCTGCETRCDICRRTVCGACRKGFVWGRAPIAACPACFRSLKRRALHDQGEAIRQAMFLRAMQVQREQLRATALRLQAARAGLMIGERGAAMVRGRPTYARRL